MAWDQGLYPVLDGLVEEIGLNDAPRVIREHNVDWHLWPFSRI
jgi:hypothetical protein